MSKERAAAIDAIRQKLAEDNPANTNAGKADQAILVLIADGLRSLDRIATALEKIAAKSEGAKS